MDKLEETAREILKTYEFGRFVKFLERVDILRDEFLDEKEDYCEAVRSAQDTLVQFVLLDQSRFKDAIEWALKREGNFPDLTIRRAHINLLFNLNCPFYKTPFYANAPTELKKAANELYETGFVFYRRDIHHRNGGGSEYKYGGADLLADCEKAIVSARGFLDLGCDYLDGIYSKR
jgi:hypothetical protein